MAKAKASQVCEMDIVIGANIFTSALIQPAGILHQLIILNNSTADLVIPDYALAEIALEKEKTCAITDTNFDGTPDALLPYILVFA